MSPRSIVSEEFRIAHLSDLDALRESQALVCDEVQLAQAVLAAKRGMLATSSRVLGDGYWHWRASKLGRCGKPSAVEALP